MWLKNFRNKKMQTLLIGLILLLCALLLSTSLSILLSLDEPLGQLAEECNSAFAVIYPYAEEDEESVGEIAKRLEALKEVQKAVCVRKHYVSEKLTSKGKEIETFTYLTEYDEEIFEDIRCVEGNCKDFEKLNIGECVIPACISVENDLQIGDDFIIHAEGEDITYTVKGIYADVYSTSNAFSNYTLVKRLPQQLSSEMEIRLFVKGNVTEEQVLDRYEETYGNELEGQMNTKSNAIESTLLAVRILGGILLAIGAIMLLTCCLIVNFVLRSIMTSDAKTIAIYKTMGYDNHTIRGLYTKFYFVVTTVGIFSGILISRVVTNHILNDLFANIGEQANVHVEKIGIVIYGLILLLVLGTVYLVTSRMKKMKPVHALGSMSPTDTMKKKNYKGDYRGAFSSFGIALRMIMRDKKGTIGILIVAIVSVIGINFGLVSLDVALNMKENNDYWLGIDKCDVMITASGNVTAEEIEEKLEGDFNIEKTALCCMSGVLIVEREKNGKNAVVYPFVYEDFDEVDLSIVKGRNPQKKDEIALAGKVAETLHKDVGDYVSLKMGQSSKSFLITGIYQTYYSMGESCRLIGEAYEGVPFSYDTVSVYLKDNKDIPDEVERIEELIGGRGKVIPRTEQFASIMEMISKPQESAIPAVILMVVLIGSINIFCIIMLKNQKEVKINSIYKCLGYTSGHLMAANLWFVSLLALASILTAVPILLYLYPKILKLSLGAMFGLLEYRVTYNMPLILGGNIGIFVLFIISTLLSSGGIRKINVRDLVIE